MSENKNKKILYINPDNNKSPDSRDIVTRLAPLSGSSALNMVLDHENPKELVRSMTKIDLYWLIKKVGETDSSPLLALATTQQWQYILDMEVWNKDTLNMPGVYQWLTGLHRADPEKLAGFLYSDDGSLLSHFFFSRIIDLKIKDNDDFVPPEGYISFDNLYYVKILAGEQSQEVEAILKDLAFSDHTRFQSLILGIQGSIPSEMEEEMYRLRSVRLAEEGYLPFDEAASVYAYIKCDRLEKDSTDYILNIPDDDDIREMIPVTPFIAAREDDFFAVAVNGINDYLVLDRLRLEFAGLCNQIFSADMVRLESVEDLTGICRKAGGYINTGLEKLSGGSRKLAEEFIKNHPLISLFRAGFSQALELKWQAKRWIEASWFVKNNFGTEFWGEYTGEVLKGLLLDKPLYYSRGKAGESHRDFCSMDEIMETEIHLRRMIFFDMLMEVITSGNKHLAPGPDKNDDTVIYSLVITLWVRKMTGLPENFEPLSIKEAGHAFDILRRGEKSAPFNMNSCKGDFTDFFNSFHLPEGSFNKDFIKETLEALWDEFTGEYAMVEISDLDPKYSKYVLIDKN